MLKHRAKYAVILAAVAAPIYLVIQLILGSNARPAAVRSLWFFLVIFLVSLAVKWEAKGQPPATAEETEPNSRP